MGLVSDPHVLKWDKGCKSSSLQKDAVYFMGLFVCFCARSLLMTCGLV